MLLDQRRLGLLHAIEVHLSFAILAQHQFHRDPRGCHAFAQSSGLLPGVDEPHQRVFDLAMRLQHCLLIVGDPGIQKRLLFADIVLDFVIIEDLPLQHGCNDAREAGGRKQCAGRVRRIADKPQ